MQLGAGMVREEVTVHQVRKGRVTKVTSSDRKSLLITGEP